MWMHRDRHAGFQSPSAHASVESDRGPGVGREHTLGEPTRRRQAVHELPRRHLCRTLRVAITTVADRRPIQAGCSSLERSARLIHAGILTVDPIPGAKVDEPPRLSELGRFNLCLDELADIATTPTPRRQGPSRSTAA
jgi:hypothetical protein